MITRADLASLDARDPLSSKRDAFVMPEGVLYLDGNSLGPMPKNVPQRVQRLMQVEWAQDLITSWNKHGWIDLPFLVRARIPRLIGTEPDRVFVGDSTSINLFKMIGAAMPLRPGRKVVLSDSGNFPTDLYIARGFLDLACPGARLEIVAPEDVAGAIGRETALVMLTHVDYRTGRQHDMKAITATAHHHGALMLWDLAHTAGAMEVDLATANADFAVGCSYKYLNGGPGAPAWLYVAPRHAGCTTPLTGWLGHERPFAFDLDYRPAQGIERFTCGTPQLLSLAALDAALDVFDDVDMREVRRKSVALCDSFISLVEQECAGFGLILASPRMANHRGSQVSFRHAEGYAIMQALIDRGTIGDFRMPDIMRFGFCPLYLRHTDVWELVGQMKAVLVGKEWAQDRYRARNKVT